MKIDDKILSYELTGNLRKLSPGDTKKLESEKLQPDRQGLDAPDEDAVVHLSRASQEAQAIKKFLASLPDVRGDVVAGIREKIEAGTYKINHEAVADKMVDAYMNDLI